jgi:hypothetical protein
MYALCADPLLGQSAPPEAAEVHTKVAPMIKVLATYNGPHFADELKDSALQPHSLHFCLVSI